MTRANPKHQTNATAAVCGSAPAFRRQHPGRALHFCFVALVGCVRLHAIDCWTGNSGPVSTHYAVEVIVDAVVHRPTVFQVLGGADAGMNAKGRSTSFLDIGMNAHESAIVVVRSLQGAAFEPGTEVRPLSYGIHGEVLEGGLAFRFRVVGNRKWISLHPAPAPGVARDRSSLSRDAFLLFVTAPIPDPGSGPNVLRFPAGAYQIGHDPAGRGIMTLPKNVDTVWLERGAWVSGKIALPKGRRCRVLGPGVLSGEGFSYANRRTEKDDAASMIDASNAEVPAGSSGPPRWVHVHGPTIVQAPRFNLNMGAGALVEQVKVIGWSLNNDGIRLGKRSEARDCFVKTGDDAFRFLDSEARVSRAVVWQHGNGGCFDSGWQAPKGEQTACVVEDSDVVAAEWTWTRQEPGSRAVIAVWRRAELSQIRDFVFHDIRVDDDVMRAISIGFREEGRGSIQGLKIVNLSLRGIVTGENALAAIGTRRSVRDVVFIGLRIGGRLIQDPAEARLFPRGDVREVRFEP